MVSKNKKKVKGRYHISKFYYKSKEKGNSLSDYEKFFNFEILIIWILKGNDPTTEKITLLYWKY
jgi:hypothetical protein